MLVEEIREAIDVGVSFRKGAAPAPRWFVRRGRKVEIKGVENSWRGRRGDSPLLFFSVTDGTDVYEICLDQKRLLWTLEKVYVEG
ncbi:MAG TPA: hypothetical protein PK876_10365 [Elusimicrobiota bacterium]|nr:hypothetical protein [Elusimicrobiota bacterium]